MDTRTKNAADAGRKPTKKVSVSYHPELQDMYGHRKKQAGAGNAPAGPQGRFPDGWQAKHAERPAKRQRLETNDPMQYGGHWEDRNKGQNGRTAKAAGYAANDRNMRRSSVQGYTGHDAIQPKREPCWTEEYSSTCCGKCKHHLRVWGARVWVCDNSGSEKHRFPTDYGNTCICFEREDR